MKKIWIIFFVAVTFSIQCFGQNVKEKGSQAANEGRFSEAYAIWLPLAESGDREVQEALALLLSGDYDLGVKLGAEERAALARKWLVKSALNGQESAMKWLSDAFSNGWLKFGVNSDAAKCWKKAAERKVTAMSCKQFISDIK